MEKLPSANRWSFPSRPDSHHTRWIQPDPRSPKKLFLAVEAGALISTPDDGYTWRDAVPGSPFDTHHLVIHPDVPQHIWSAAAMASLKVSTVARRGRRPTKACDFATVGPSQLIRAIGERSSFRLLRDPPRLIGSGMQNLHFFGGKVMAIGSKFRPDYPSREGRSRRSSPAIPPSPVSFTPRSTRPFIAPLMGANRGDRFRSTGPPDLPARAFTGIAIGSD